MNHNLLIVNAIYRKRFIKFLFCIFNVSVIIILSHKYFLHENVLVQNNRVFQSVNDNPIPTIVHFVIGQGDLKGIKHKYALSSPFSFINYLCMLAARRQIRPEKLYVHYYEEPNTFWWNQTKQDPDIDITLIKSRQITSIFNRSVDHHAHRGDIIRLETVIKYGGIYLDMDVLALRSFEPLLNLSDVIMALQSDNPKTVCNAVIIGKKNASFLRRVYDSYESFNAKCWDCHSVYYTGYLASMYTNEIKVLPTINFFRPDWQQSHVFFHSNDYNFSMNYASHLWNKANNVELNKVTPDRILSGNFTLARMFLHSIGKEKIEKLKNFFIENSKH